MRSLLFLLPALALAACAPPDPGEVSVALKGTELAHCCDNAEFYPPPVMKLADPLMPLLGPVFGNVVFREGYLEKPSARQAIEARLQPMDMLVLSSKNRLSGKTLPGLFGHAVIYLGDEASLRRSGLWNDPRITPHHADIRAGKTYIEADTNGVHLSDATHALATDALAILRLKSGCGTDRCAPAEVIETLGRDYDFRFEGEDHSKLYCTELAQIALPGHEMPKRRLYDYNLILPDDVVALAIAGRSPMKLVSYFSGTADKRWHESGRKGLLRDMKGWWDEAQKPPAL